MKEIILAPFNLDAIYAMHILDEEREVRVCGFFDNNEALAHRTYVGRTIYPPFYRNETEIHICARRDGTRAALKTQFTSLGYAPEQIVTVDPEALIKKKSAVMECIRIDDLARLKPLQAFLASVEIRKKRMCRSLQAPDEEHFYRKFDLIQGEQSPKSFVDAEGKTHLLLSVLTLYVTDRCSLRCRYCGAGKQYYTPQEARDVPLATLMRDYDRILNVVDWIDTVEIIGGEPFLRTDLDEILEGVYRHPFLRAKVGQLLLVTNATIVPRERVLRAMARYENLFVHISNYCSINNRINELVEALERWQIRYDVTDFKGKGKGWTKTLQLAQDRPALDADALLEKRRHGCITHCNSVKEGRFYLCDLLVSMHDLHAVPDERGISVDIYAPDAREQLARYLSLDVPLPPACAWCTGCSPEDWKRKGIPAAEQVAAPVKIQRFQLANTLQ